MKSLTGVIVLMLALTLGIFNIVFAADKAAAPAAPAERQTQQSSFGEKSSNVLGACKGKKAGSEVTVDGKKLKCPALGTAAGIAVSDPGTPSDKSGGKSSSKKLTVDPPLPGVSTQRGKPNKEQRVTPAASADGDQRIPGKPTKDQ